MVIAAIGSVPLMMTLGNSMLIPILPKMKSSLDLTQLQVSLTITVFSIAAAIFIPIVGYLSDRFSRKMVIIPSLLLFGGGALLAGLGAAVFSNSYIWVILGRILQGIGAAGTAPIAMALIGDLFRGGERSRVLGIFEASNGLGKVLSPILGSLLALIIWYSVFFAFPVISLISILLVWIFIKEKRNFQAPPPFKKYVKGLLSVFKHEGRWLFTIYLAGGTCLFTLFGILFYLSDILETKYNINGVPKGLILAIPLLVMVCTSYITGSKIGKNLEKMKWLSVLGLFLMTLSYSSLVLFEKLIPFLIVLAISSIGAGLVLPCVNSLITGAVGKERRGFVSSLYGSVRFIGVALGPPVFTRLMDWSRTGMFLSIAAFTLLVALLVLLLVHVKGKDGKEKKKSNIRYKYT
ncbi:MFS transporter [Oceanobacillus caeni]|uniref:MFS transporter n=1 Tax=Oceanobacillus caeni TaxID=405946 RepID=UPI000DAA5B8A|nr:MFS transporter [Oceanobacillus caeni]PZD84643.1 MFS transporter [Bacilli bacterium]MCR1834789.1 MFS transporter [Oceanobacillus caeni]PZD89217.1 MFS transporter [Bacilli bacterium]PZD91789.1 MFS transporter [Bacilli bacterium]RCO06012.1 MFS transporter [Bacilli bacterium]